jgi:hypothetical protein
MLQAHTWNMLYLLLFYSNNDFANSPSGTFIRVLPVLLELHTTGNGVFCCRGICMKSNGLLVQVEEVTFTDTRL